MAIEYLNHPDSGRPTSITRHGNSGGVIADWNMDKYGPPDIDLYTKFAIPYAAKPFIHELERKVKERVRQLSEEHDHHFHTALRKLGITEELRLHQLTREWQKYHAWLALPAGLDPHPEGGKVNHPDGPFYVLGLCIYNWPVRNRLSREQILKLEPLLLRLNKQVEAQVERTIRDELKKNLMQ